MSIEKNEALREKSKSLLNSLKTNQDLIRQQLIKIRQSENYSPKKQIQSTVKTVSFSDFPLQNASKESQVNKRIRSKSESSLRQNPRSDCHFEELESSSSTLDSQTSESEIESDDLAGLIRFKELKTLKELKARDESEFLKHVEATRQEFLKRDYSENESDTGLIKTKRHSRKKEAHVRKTSVKKNSEEVRAKSAPSYMRPTEASQKMCRQKSPKSQTSRDKNKNKKSDKSNQSVGRNRPKNKPLLGLDFVLGLFFNIDALGVFFTRILIILLILIDTLETKSSTKNGKNQKSEEYWQELCQFREENKNDCYSSKPINFDGTTSSLFLDQSNVNEYFKQTDNELEDGINHRCKIKI